MKKKLLAAALVAGFAGFTGVAQADSVVLYGTLDGGVGFNTYTIKMNENNVQKTTAAGRGFAFENGMNEGSKLGFRGDAFIWGSTSAFFKLETNLNILNGASGSQDPKNLTQLFDGGAFFGFTSPSWGTLSAGYQGSASSDFALLPFSNFAIGGALPSGKVGDITPSDLFNANVYGNAAGTTSSNLKYVTPRFFGLQLGVSYDFNLAFLSSPSNGADAPKYKLATFQPGAKPDKLISKQHASVGIDFAMGPVELAATYDAYMPAGHTYVFNYHGMADHPNKDANNTEQSYSVGASVNIRGILVQASWAQAFSDIAFNFGKDSSVGGNVASSLYPTFIHSQDGGITKKFRNNAFSASITIPATEDGQFYFAYNGAITKANRVVAMKDDANKMDESQSTKVKAFSQLWRAGYVQNISKYTSLYVYAGFGDVKFYQKPATQSGWKDANELGTARLQQYGIGITHNF